VRLVVVACHSENDDIKPGTLSSMIRQSGRPKRTFRP
jgi:predicted RNA binding protein YcfA (HicA-like mRNA interferase family)